ncbi:hypothetical protein V1512DRAFT_268435 [Lipomyces arxii]|uniref:uncharacterized protein n=1 Tax=Lipomyces arxii TaxID=56418 RepID=UPI0034CD1406
MFSNASESSSTINFDFSKINWNKADPVTIVNAYREALQRQEQQQKQRILGSQLLAIEDSRNDESSDTVSPTIASTDLHGANSSTIEVAPTQNNKRQLFSQSHSSGSTRLSHQSSCSPNADSNYKQKVAKYAVATINQANQPRSRLAKMRASRRQFRKYAPPSYFAQVRKPGEKITTAVVISAQTQAEDFDDHEPAIESNAFSASTDFKPSFSAADLEIAKHPVTPQVHYVTSSSQTDFPMFNTIVTTKPRPLDLSEIAPERKKRPGYFSANFDDDSEEEDGQEPGVIEPIIKRRRLFVSDDASLASSPAFRSILSSTSSAFSHSRKIITESDISRRRLEFEIEEKELLQKEQEAKLQREREEKEQELARQREELEQERQRQIQKQKELEQKEQQLQARLAQKEKEQAAISVPAVPSVPSVSTASSTPPVSSFSVGSIGSFAAPASKDSGFSFAVPTSTSSAAPAGNGFTFGAGGSFGAPASTNFTSNDATPKPAVSTGTTFSFNSTPIASSNSGFSISSTKRKDDADTNADKLEEIKKLKFSAGSSAAESATSLFSTSATPTAAPAFSDATAAAMKTDTTTTGAGALSFKFGGATSTPVAGEQPAAKSIPSFSFGVSTKDSNATVSTPSSTSASTSSSSKSIPAFSFGQSSTTAPSLFGQSSSTAVSSAPPAAPAPASTTFAFGQSSTTGTSAFGQSQNQPPAASSAPSFSFAASSGSANPASVFGFGTTPSTPASTPFGGASAPAARAETPSFSFGSSAADPGSVFGFGAAPATPAVGPVPDGGVNGGGNIFASSTGTPPPGRKVAPMRGRLNRRRQ